MKKPLSRAKRKAEKPTGQKLIAMTVKIENDVYVRLSTLRAKERKTAQEILTDALQKYLDRAGA
jgi:predicted transcriptional regulator